MSAPYFTIDILNYSTVGERPLRVIGPKPSAFALPVR